MVAISFYRGNLHRVPDRPRQWPMPTHSISLRDFKLLTRRRSKALSLLRTVPNPSDHPKQDSQPVIEDGPADIKPQPQQQPQQEEQQQIHAQDSQPQPSITPNIVGNYDNAMQPQKLANTPGTMERTGAGVAPLDSCSSPPPKPALPNGGNGQEDCGGSGSKDLQGKEAAVDSGKAEMEVANGLDVPSDKEKRKKELEKKLQILNERKHQLVQALKQILNAEEEMTRRNSIQISGGRAAVPLQAEAQAVPKMSSEANLGDDLEGESEDASNHNTHARHLQQTQCTSPSTASPLRRPVCGSLQHNTVPYPSRGSLVAAGHTQTTSIFFADKSEDFINAQVNALLHSLDIDNDLRMKGHLPGRFPELEEYWTESQGASRSVATRVADRWVGEYNSMQGARGNPESWADSFERQHGANGWASEFDQEQSQMASIGQMGGANVANIAAMEQTRMLAHTLAQNSDPKFQNSKFLQFVSKMSRGELIIDDNQVKPAVRSVDWVDEYAQQYNGPNSWADQFAREELSNRTDAWANEFANAHQHPEAVDDQWVNEFSKLNVQDWAEEFGQQVNEGALGESSADDWFNSYDKFVDEQVMIAKERDTSRSVYVFSDMNPYVGHPNPLKEGQELFRKGLLSEAVLALEAEVLKNPDNAEGWRLLGITHAENDDDQQAIASMMRAHEADPTNLEVLLALGVSHTNELERSAALKYLYSWLQHHSKYGALAPPEQPASLYHADVVTLFNEAAQMSPNDADVHIVLGVLYNLSREYDKAILSFQTALKLKPRDYSLWNKLGATQANSVQSSDAILAYQQALDLKPNYVRAWANMGISFANQGLYEESIRYYVRALTMNPKADNAWQYLRISLSCASRADMFGACESRNLDVLQKEFPL